MYMGGGVASQKRKLQRGRVEGGGFTVILTKGSPPGEETGAGGGGLWAVGVSCGKVTRKLWKHGLFSEVCYTDSSPRMI